MVDVVVATAFGGPEVLEVVSQDRAPLAAGQVRIEVHAIGANPIDYKSYSGMMGADPSILPKRIGSEASGVVIEVGAGVDSLAAGDAVIAYPAPGAYASELVADVSALTIKPAALGWGEAAGLLLTGATATHLLEATGVHTGDTVLINGASGGVGLFAVQLAVQRGAKVIATASASAHELLSSLGATPVTYGPGLVDRVRALAPSGVTVALDLVGTDEAVDASLELVADRARIATIAAFGRAANDGIQLLGGGPGADPGTEIRSAARAGLAEQAATGQLKVLIAATFPLAEAAAAHRALAGPHAPGKIVLLA